MSFNHDEIKMPKNVQTILYIILMLDGSGSTHGQANHDLNEALKRFLIQIKENHKMRQSIEISIVEFNSDAHILLESQLAADIDQMPEVNAEGGTEMQAGIEMALDLVTKRKQEYRELGMSYHRPLLLLLTDGEPNTKNGLTELAERIRIDTTNKKYSFLGFGIGDQADMTVIQNLNGYVDGKQMPALKISDSTHLGDFVDWLSRSVSRDPNDVAEAVKDWKQGFTV
ncbi:VWA domain-containing protein [uncultured Tolumonas sp.]|uniref:vWA domain-containing protein n=1 Tax=uncultured Tolumonas sp. TaxID=263765 RepID=UPI002A0A9469|nr:VWA domain-containing protein [uncultured Tolumonas sp.]